MSKLPKLASLCLSLSLVACSSSSANLRRQIDGEKLSAVAVPTLEESRYLVSDAADTVPTFTAYVLCAPLPPLHDWYVFAVENATGMRRIDPEPGYPWKVRIFQTTGYTDVTHQTQIIVTRSYP